MPRVFRSEHGGQDERQVANAVTGPERAAVGVLLTSTGTDTSRSAISLRAAAAAYCAGRSVAVRHRWIRNFARQCSADLQVPTQPVCVCQLACTNDLVQGAVRCRWACRP